MIIHNNKTKNSLYKLKTKKQQIYKKIQSFLRETKKKY